MSAQQTNVSAAAAAKAAAPAKATAKPASEKKRKEPADFSAAETPNFTQMSQEGKPNRSSNGAGKVPKKSAESPAIQKLKQALQDLYVKQKTNQRQMDDILAIRKFAKAWESYKLFREADHNFDLASQAMEKCNAYAEFMDKATVNNEGKPQDPIDVMRSADKFGNELEEQITDAKKRLLDQRDKEAIEAAAKRAAEKEAKEAAAREEAAAKEAAAKEKLEANKAEELALMERLAQLRAEMPPLEAVAVEAVDVEKECSSPEDGSPAPKRTYTFTCKFCGAVTEGHMCKKKTCVTQRKAANKLSQEKNAATYGKGSSNPHSSDSSDEDQK